MGVLHLGKALCYDKSIIFLFFQILEDVSKLKI